ncbi:MAG: metallophosphoesterase family protein [bacterium]
MNTRETARTIIVGVLSDTHGYLYPPVKRLLEGVDHIIHAGDVGSARVLAELRTLAPVTAVRGNCDAEVWAQSLPARAEVDLGEARILVGHVAGRLRAEAGDGGFAVVISGHSHLASYEERDGVLYLNPGSAGPRRFGRPRTVARLEIRPRRGAEAKKEAGSGPHISATILTAESE